MNNKHLEPLGGGIKIYVSDSYRFSTDTILLADFSKQIGAKKCVDLGTGCGTIPLLWYKNNNRLDITAVEIQENACKLFSQSLEYNNLQDKIRIVNSDLNKLDGALPAIRPTKSAEAELQIPKMQSLLQDTNQNVRLTMCAVAVRRFCSLGDGSAFVSAPKDLPMQWRQCVNIRLSRKNYGLFNSESQKPRSSFCLKAEGAAKGDFLRLCQPCLLRTKAETFPKKC